MTHPNFQESFLIFVDGSSTGIGFTLVQIQNGKEVVIAYIGRGLNQAEQNYQIRKISPGAYIFQRPFLRGLCLEGLIFGGKFAFQNRLG